MTLSASSLANYSLAELKSLDVVITQQIQILKKREIEAARQQIHDIARSVGLSVQEVLGAASGKMKDAGAGLPKAPLAGMYSNPENPSEQWSGRGRQPGWAKALIAAGRKIEDCRTTAQH